jgi:UDP:flavonoid glycosyltransferase YjiC (YdhE family)
MVVGPGGGDQWELANRVVRQGSARLIRPLSPDALIAGVAEVLLDPGYRHAARRAGDFIAGVADPVAVCRAAAAGRAP